MKKSRNPSAVLGACAMIAMLASSAVLVASSTTGFAALTDKSEQSEESRPTWNPMEQEYRGELRAYLIEGAQAFLDSDKENDPKLFPRRMHVMDLTLLITQYSKKDFTEKEVSSAILSLAAEGQPISAATVLEKLQPKRFD